METSELRRFNLVLFDGNLYQVFSVDPCFVGLSLPGKDELIGSLDVCWVSPVTLDDEVLCTWGGFKELFPGMFCREEDLSYTPTGFPNGFIISSYGRNDGKFSVLNCGSSCAVEFLHQLQNLYFANKGQELQINF